MVFPDPIKSESLEKSSLKDTASSNEVRKKIPLLAVHLRAIGEKNKYRTTVVGTPTQSSFFFFSRNRLGLQKSFFRTEVFFLRVPFGESTANSPSGYLPTYLTGTIIKKYIIAVGTIPLVNERERKSAHRSEQYYYKASNAISF